MFETGVQQQDKKVKNKSAAKHVSGNSVLTLDKDVNELQLTFEMFKDQLN